jgi:hypothetical protein
MKGWIKPQTRNLKNLGNDLQLVWSALHVESHSQTNWFNPTAFPAAPAGWFLHFLPIVSDESGW